MRCPNCYSHVLVLEDELFSYCPYCGYEEGGEDDPEEHEERPADAGKRQVREAGLRADAAADRGQDRRPVLQLDLLPSLARPRREA